MTGKDELVEGLHNLLFRRKGVVSCATSCRLGPWGAGAAACAPAGSHMAGAGTAEEGLQGMRDR